MTTTNRYVGPCLARFQREIARETRQRDEALVAGNRRKAAEHQDRIDRLASERAVLADRYLPQEPAGVAVQTEMML